MVINNNLKDLGYIIGYSLSEILKEKDEKFYDDFQAFISLHMDIFQLYQLENLKNVLEIYLYFEKDLNTLFNKNVQKWLKELKETKIDFHVNTSIEIHAIDVWEEICFRMQKESLTKESLLYFLVPNFFLKNKDTFSSDFLTRSKRYFDEIGCKNGSNEKKHWLEFFENIN